MTAATDEAWIQNSLARLETLETQREQLAATGQTAKLAEIDEEIRSLYEALEAVAGDEEGDEPANEAAAPVAAAPMAAPAPTPVTSDPFGAPASPPMAAAPASPLGEPGMGMGMDAPMAASPGYVDDIDIKPPRGPLPIILVVLLLVGGGAGAYFLLGNKTAEEPASEPTGPAVVIEAGEIVEDTQEPVVAKGADADRTRGTNFKESSRSSRPASRSSNSNRSSRPRTKKKDPKKVEVKGDANDPLAGI